MQGRENPTCIFGKLGKVSVIRTDRPCVRGLRTGRAGQDLGGTGLKDSVYDLCVYIASAYTQSGTLCLPVWAPAVGGKALSWSWVDIQKQNAGHPAIHRRGEVCPEEHFRGRASLPSVSRDVFACFKRVSWLVWLTWQSACRACTEPGVPSPHKLSVVACVSHPSTWEELKATLSSRPA